MKEQNKNRIDWELLARDMAGELSEQEHEELSRQLQEDAVGDVLDQVKDLWGDTKYAQELAAINTDKAWQNVNRQMSKTKVRMLRRVISVAAMLVVIVSAYFMYTLFSQSGNQSVRVAKMETESVKLPDGTDVSVNGGSVFKYPDKFEASTRTVELDGEAFFDVKRDEARPFIIQTDKVQIKVLGTSFNVKAYSPDKNAIVTVSSGRVQVAVNEVGQNVILNAGETAVYDAVSSTLIKKQNTNINYHSWKTKEIVFEDDTALSDVFSTIEQVYQIDIVITDSTLIQGEVFNGNFSHYSLDHVLETVCSSFGLDYEEEDGVYVIR